MTRLRSIVKALIPTLHEAYYYCCGLAAAFFVVGHTTSGIVWAAVALVVLLADHR